MTNLHEQYETLLGRGMPECEVIEWLSPMIHVGKLSDKEAEDALWLAILAPHVRNWLANLRSKEPDIYKPQIGVEWYEHDDITHIWMTKVKTMWAADVEENIHYRKSYYEISPEEAMIRFAVEATEHLEPADG